ncbi:MAG: chemotaxis protein CheB [Lysobacteraceae bacterium SCN 69-48]|nr:MAG: chemotaxis protein CheB [Xanthomonadaceae bacterium SCN 69-48]
MSLLKPTPRAIVIGASAGGVLAVRELLAGLPAGLPCALLVVIHLPRGRPSQLAEVMDGAVALPVMEAEDKQPIVPGQVLLAPPDYHLMVEDAGHVALSVDAPPMYSMPSIDVLFESAAHVWQHELLAIVLTGASARAGGRVWVQDPGEAEMPMMPAAVLAAAGADAVLTLKQMVRQLVEVCG